MRKKTPVDQLQDPALQKMLNRVDDPDLQVEIARALGEAGIPLHRRAYGIARGILFPDVATFVRHVAAIRDRQRQAGEAPRLYVSGRDTKRRPDGVEIWFTTWVRSFERQYAR